MKTPDINQILRDAPRSGRYGAPMGASDVYPVNEPWPRLLLQRVRFIDGDYAADGTYWGGGRGTEPLWCAFNGAGGDYLPGMGVRLYVRGYHRDRAAERLAVSYPDIVFVRGNP